MFLLLLLPCLSLASAPLPDYMLGTFQLKGFTNYMYKVGVDWFTRKIAYSLYPTATNELVDGQIRATTTATREGNTLIKNQVCVDTSSSCLSTIESRELQEEGLKMTLVHTIPGHPGIRSTRRSPWA